MLEHGESATHVFAGRHYNAIDQGHAIAFGRLRRFSSFVPLLNPQQKKYFLKTPVIHYSLRRFTSRLHFLLHLYSCRERFRGSPHGNSVNWRFRQLTSSYRLPVSFDVIALLILGLLLFARCCNFVLAALLLRSLVVKYL